MNKKCITFLGHNKCGVNRVAKLSADILFFDSCVKARCKSSIISLKNILFSLGRSNINNCIALRSLSLLPELFPLQNSAIWQYAG